LHFLGNRSNQKSRKIIISETQIDMKYSAFIWVILLLITGCCQKEKDENSLILDQSFDIKYKEIKIDAENGIIISLDSVMNDSRCPVGCYCFWAGNAEVRFDFSQDNYKIKFVLNTFSGWRSDTLINGYRIKLVDLKPYPETGKIISQNDYHAEVKITLE
jgi:hypothetical protein